jgi:hypothetical protein
MKEIGVNGSDPILDDNQKAERHGDQLQDLQRLIRLGSADFIARSLKPPVTKLIIWITVAYSIVLLGAGVLLLVAAGSTKGSEHLSKLVGGWTYVAIGLAGAVVVGGMIDRRLAYLRQVDAAGVESTEKVLARYKQRQP